MTADEQRQRLASIDLLRGIVVVVMALDHCRDFFSPFPFAPEDLSQASPALFLTRWVTHFCAPVFVLLAGLGTGLAEAKAGDKRGLSAFLFQRGVWLIVLEFTLSNIAWLSYWNGYGFVQVLWALGWSMILLAGLVHLPRPALWVGSLTLLVGHHLLDGIQARELEAPLSYVWGVLHQPMWVPMGGSFGFSIIYPLLPWPAIMVLGYLMAPVFGRPPEARRRLLIRVGLLTTAAFVVLRMVNVYGDPSPWQVQERGALFTGLSFLNTTKYPVSLLFTLMTIGPAVLALPWLERWRGRFADFFLTFGRVPLFFYLLHFFAIHLMAAIYSQVRYGATGWWVFGPNRWPEGYTPNLVVTYLGWFAVLALFVPLCRWFGAVKSRRREWWIRFL